MRDMAAQNNDPTQAFVQGVRHPLRRLILRRLAGTGERASPNQLSRELEVKLSAVSYHVRVLATNGLVEPAGTKLARGTVEHFYRVRLSALDHPVVKAIVTMENDA